MSYSNLYMAKIFATKRMEARAPATAQYDLEWWTANIEYLPKTDPFILRGRWRSRFHSLRS